MNTRLIPRTTNGKSKKKQRTKNKIKSCQKGWGKKISCIPSKNKFKEAKIKIKGCLCDKKKRKIKCVPLEFP
jgi:hypothetical protein